MKNFSLGATEAKVLTTLTQSMDETTSSLWCEKLIGSIWGQTFCDIQAMQSPV